MIILDILMFVVFAATVALTVFMLIKFPENAKTISVLQSPDDREDEGYRAQKYNRLMSRFSWLTLLSFAITLVCFYFDKFPNKADNAPAWTAWLIIAVFLIVFVGFYTVFCMGQVKNNIAVYHEGYKTSFQKVGKIINRRSMRKAAVIAMLYSMIVYFNAITLWFMIA